MTHLLQLLDLSYAASGQIRPAKLPVMKEALFLAGLTFLVTLLLGGQIVRILRRYRIGKKVRLDGPATHLVKEGTPTMGGLMIVLSVFAVNALFNLSGRLSMALPLGVVLSAGTLGAVDDLLNTAGGKRSGIAARFKFSWLLLFAIAAALTLHFPFQLRSAYIPFVGKVDIGLWYIPIAVGVIVGTSNAVNLTDGVDTLAGGLLALAFAAYGAIAYLQGQDFLTALCFTVVGGLLGFLWFNAHPAHVIMGDTGSLSLGALLATVAFMTGQWLLLPVVGIVFVLEALSVMLQVVYFKLTHGKRILRMSPLHHHFEMLGWSETQVAVRFWLVGMVAAMAGVGLALS